MKTLSNLLRELLVCMFRLLKMIYGYDIAKSVTVSIEAKLARTYPRGIHIGEENYVASGFLVFYHMIIVGQFMMMYSSVKDVLLVQTL